MGSPSHAEIDTYEDGRTHVTTTSEATNVGEKSVSPPGTISRRIRLVGNERASQAGRPIGHPEISDKVRDIDRWRHPRKPSASLRYSRRSSEGILRLKSPETTAVK